MEEGRARQALALIGLAALAVLVAGVLYLHPALGRPAGPGGSPSPGRSRAPLVLPLEAAFSDDLRGWVFGSSSPGGAAEVNSMASGPWVLMTTRDGGRTWRQFGLTFPSSPGPGLLLAYVHSVAAGTYAVDLSDDGGQSWRPLALPALTGNQLRFAFASSQDGWLLDCRADGTREVPEAVWRTTDGGGSWSRLPTPDLTGLGSLADLRFVDTDRGVLAVTAAGAAPPVLLATEDGGVTWRRVAELDVPPPRPAYLNVELASAGPRVLAVLEAFNGPSPPSQVYTAASADGGQTWTPVRAGPLTGVASVPGVRGVDRLILFDGLRLWSSADGGASWAVRPVRLPDALEPIGPVSGGQRTLFVLAGDVSPTGRFEGQRSLLSSADGGVHWAPLALPRPRPSPMG